MSFVKHEACPKCGSRDNLARYTDGSAWCFGCRKWEPPTEAPWVREDVGGRMGKYPSNSLTGESEEEISTIFPRGVLDWLSSYGITVEEALRYGWCYSPRWDQLLFPLKDEHGTTVCTQARNFNPQRKSKAKYYNKGEKSAHWTIFLPQYSARYTGRETSLHLLVLTEDVLSAAKVGLSTPAMPLLGVHIGRDKLKRLRASYDSLVVWLDSDKWREARDIAEAAKFLGFKASTLLTEKDPKEYTVEQIKEYLKWAQRYRGAPIGIEGLGTLKDSITALKAELEKKE